MEILGIGLNELIFIVIIALIVLGPKDMQKAGRTIGKWMRDIVTSEGWKVFQQTSREIRTLPNRLMREANEELNQINKDLAGPAGFTKRPQSPNPPPRSRPLSPPTGAPQEATIAPPEMENKKVEADQEGNE